MNNNRNYWIDRMKVIGMYLIILGHFFSIGYKYVYIFSVPLFFILSGYLENHKDSHWEFIKKLFHKLFTPTCIICLIMYIWNAYIYIINNQSLQDFPAIHSYVLMCLKGNQGPLGTCWFIYTLIIIKFIHHFLPSNKGIQLTFFLLFSIISITLHYYQIHCNSAILNVCVAYPLYIIGLQLHCMDKYFIYIFNFYNRLLLFAISIITIVICAKYNGYVWMYNNGYGNNFLLFLIGSISGTIMLFALCTGKKNKFDNCITISSKGNIITLGFHQIFVYLCRIITPNPSYIDFLYSAIILLLFFPIIIICRNYFPILSGSYKK